MATGLRKPSANRRFEPFPVTDNSMGRRRWLYRLWWAVFPPSELRVVYGQISRWRSQLQPIAPVPDDAIATARRMARLFDDVPALVRTGRAPSGIALTLLQSALEQPLIVGDGYSYRGRLSPRGRQYHEAWLEVTRLMVDEGELSAEEYEEAQLEIREVMRSRG